MNASDWIPVSERLPETEPITVNGRSNARWLVSDTLLFFVDGSVCFGCYVEHEGERVFSEHDGCDTLYPIARVTHWQSIVPPEAS